MTVIRYRRRPHRSQYRSHEYTGASMDWRIPWLHLLAILGLVAAIFAGFAIGNFGVFVR